MFYSLFLGGWAVCFVILVAWVFVYVYLLSKHGEYVVSPRFVYVHLAASVLVMGLITVAHRQYMVLAEQHVLAADDIVSAVAWNLIPLGALLIWALMLGKGLYREIREIRLMQDMQRHPEQIITLGTSDDGLFCVMYDAAHGITLCSNRPSGIARKRSTD